MKRFFLFALIATVFVACSTDATQDLAPEIPTSPNELYVSFDEEDSRVQLQNGTPVWTEGDLVSVFYKSDGNDCYKFTDATGDRSGTLMRTSVGEWSRRGDNVVVVYPYNKDYIISLASNTVEASLPAEQTYMKDSYGVGSSLMVASGDYKQFALKNVCGWLKLQFTGSGYVSKIVLRGNNGEQVAGNLLVCADDASCILAETSADINNDEVGGALITDGDILTEVTLNCGDGVALNPETPTAFYIALPPQTFTKGLTITMYGIDGTSKEISTDNTISIERNHIVPMASTEMVMPIANNEIWYTSTDGNIVEPYDTSVFGATIVSSTYENGKGVITFDGKVTSIGYAAFYNCYTLTSITIPDGVTSIGDRAFNRCDELTSVDISDNVTEIGERAFWGCTRLTSFYGKFASDDNRCLIIDGVLNSFARRNLTSYTIPNSVTSIGKHAFDGCDKLKSITIPDSVKSIGKSAFSGCNQITNINISNSVIEIGEGAFYACYNLPSINIPNNVTSIEDNVFFGCNKLTYITIPDNVTSIGKNAFDNCHNLTNITIGNSVTSIGEEAFAYCFALKEVYCKPTTPPTGGSYMFSYNASGRKIYVPTASVDAYKAAEGWSDYASYIEPYNFTE